MLGRMDIANVHIHNDNIIKKRTDLGDCYNTFQWVTNQLEEWASQTVIGDTTKQNCILLYTNLERALAILDEMTAKIQNFTERQTQLNNQSN